MRVDFYFQITSVLTYYSKILVNILKPGLTTLYKITYTFNIVFETLAGKHAWKAWPPLEKSMYQIWSYMHNVSWLHQLHHLHMYKIWKENISNLFGLIGEISSTKYNMLWHMFFLNNSRVAKKKKRIQCFTLTFCLARKYIPSQTSAAHAWG